MALLLNSDIGSRVRRCLAGRVARAGGAMNQLMPYEQCTVEDINLPDGGFGRVRTAAGARTLWQRLRVAKRYVLQEWKFLRKGYAVSRDRKTILLDMHSAHHDPSLRGRYDCSISSNLIEHSPNPIFLLLNFFFITRKGGYQYHAIPHYKFTYDMYREPTKLEHLVEDFENMMDASDPTHKEDYIQSAIVKHGWQREFHEKYPVAYPYMHFHVFDEHNTRALFEFMFEDVVNDVIKTEEFSDNIVIFRNELNARFLETHKGHMERYSNTLLGSSP